MDYSQVNTEHLLLAQELGVALIPSYIDPNWLRWIAASVNQNFKKCARGIPVYFEGEDRKTGDYAAFAEIRMDGPLLTIPQKGLFYLTYNLNVLIQSNIDNSNFYTPQTLLGIFLLGFTDNIPVYKYGDGPLDDQSFLGCLRLYYSGHMRDRGIVVGTFGIVRNDTRLIQGSIDGQYRIELTDEGVFP